MATSTRALHSVVEEIRRRWKRRAIVRGLALTGVVSLALGFVFLLALTNVVIATTPLIAAAVLSGIIVAVSAWRFIVRPIRVQPTDEQIALFVEEQLPDLEDRFNSAIEVGGDRSAVNQTALIEKLLQDAISKAVKIRP
ncbi:MAG: hypothetical protein HKN13_05425, partial [Rhodothermales bacterium]|nr:hypothetical protein [Rhodothermales bacterium]